MLNRVLAVTVLLLIPGVALPQAVTSSIVGTVRDSSGALMAGARVKVTNTGTDFVREVVSDSRGDYFASLLPPGRYKVEVSLASFQTFVVTGITLEMDKEARVDARLEVGQVSQQVTVEASTIFLNSEKAEVGQVIPGYATPGFKWFERL